MVYHHSEIIAQLIAERKIKIKEPVMDKGTPITTPLPGPLQRVYDQPRKALKAIPGVQLVEMERNRAKSFCCGAGGARMWMEEHGDRINDARAKQALDVKADVIAVGCPSVSP